MQAGSSDAALQRDVSSLMMEPWLREGPATAVDMEVRLQYTEVVGGTPAQRMYLQGDAACFGTQCSCSCFVGQHEAVLAMHTSTQIRAPALHPMLRLSLAAPSCCSCNKPHSCWHPTTSRATW